ncbi:MAG: YunC family protein [Eubacterium sp.]|nr:YunC family protein [Eubacterium sp.]
MVTIEELTVADGKVQGTMVSAPGGEGHPNMILIQAKHGYLMCGYLNMEAAEKFGDAAVLGGGADFQAILQNPIKGMTTAAAKAGIREGMTGGEAVALLNSEC